METDQSTRKTGCLFGLDAKKVICGKKTLIKCIEYNIKFPQNEKIGKIGKITYP